MTNLTAGYDLDGTICAPCPKREKPYFKQNSEERRAYEILRRFHYKNAKIIRFPTEAKFYVITGRKNKYREETVFLLKSNRIEPVELYMLPDSFPKTRDSMVSHKIKLCKDLKIDIYYEDDPKIAKALKIAGVNVVLVKNQEGSENA